MRRLGRQSCDFVSGGLDPRIKVSGKIQKVDAFSAFLACFHSHRGGREPMVASARDGSWPGRSAASMAPKLYQVRPISYGYFVTPLGRKQQQASMKIENKVRLFAALITKRVCRDL